MSLKRLYFGSNKVNTSDENKYLKFNKNIEEYTKGKSFFKQLLNKEEKEQEKSGYKIFYDNRSNKFISNNKDEIDRYIYICDFISKYIETKDAFFLNDDEYIKDEAMILDKDVENKLDELLNERVNLLRFFESKGYYPSFENDYIRFKRL